MTDMNELLQKVRNIRAKACLSIVMNSHRSSPENLQDSIRLKNLIREAERRLTSEFDKALADKVLKNLHELAENIDHSVNLDSLVLFVNADFTAYTTLPAKVRDRVIIDDTFATRDLIRLMRMESAYYILVLSRGEARFIKALNDGLVREYYGKFPMKNEAEAKVSLKQSSAKGQDQKLEEFFNRVDKEIQDLTGQNNLPIALVTEKRNADHFMKMADHKDRYAISLAGNHSRERSQEIVSRVWPLVRDHLSKIEKEKIDLLRQAVSAGNVLSDMDEVWHAIQARKGHLLFVEKNFIRAAFHDEGSIRPLKGRARGSHIIDDVVDEMIEGIQDKGGETVFVDQEQLGDFKHLALVTRI